MSAWKDAIRDGRALSAIYGLHIEGVGTLFRSGPIVGPDDVAWTAPEDPNTVATLSYAVSDTLVISGGVVPISSAWSPEAGVMHGGGMSLRLAADSTVLGLFASHDPSTVKARLAYDVGYDHSTTTKDRYRVRVDDTTGFADPAVTGQWEQAHIGRETFAYNALSSTQFGDNTSSNIVRGLWRWRSDSRLSREHLVQQELYRERIEVTDAITSWYGRRVTVLCWLCDERGRALDSGYRGDYEVEIWSGWIRDVRVSGDWAYYDLSCAALTDVLRDEIGQDSTEFQLVDPNRGSLVNVRGDASVVPLVQVTVTSSGAVVGTSENVLITDDDGTGLHELAEPIMPLDTYLRHLSRTLNTEIDHILTDASRPETITVYVYRDIYVGADDLPLRAIVIESTPGALGLSLTVDITFSGWPIGQLSQPTSVTMVNDPGDTGQRKIISTSHRLVGNVLPDDREIIVYTPATQEEQQAEPALATGATGWGVIVSDEQGGEVFSFSSIAASTITPGAYILGGCIRGRLGTQALSYWTQEDSGSSGRTTGFDTRAPITVRIVNAYDGSPITQIIGQILASTGTSGAYASGLDTSPRTWGLAVDPAALDLDSFRSESREPPLGSERTLVLTERTSVEDIIAPQSTALDFTVLARTLEDGTYRITWVAMDQPMQHLPAESLSMAAGGAILSSALPSVRQRHDEIVTAIEIATNYDPLTNDFVGKKIRMVNANRALTHAKTRTLSLEVRGIPDGGAYEAALLIGQRVFYHRGRPWYVVDLHTDTRGLVVDVGDLVTLTIPGLPTPYSSTRGLTSATGVVVEAEHIWLSPGVSRSASLSVLLWPAGRGLAPVWTVSSYDSGTPSITVADNAWTYTRDPSPVGEETCRDWHHGPASGETWDVYVWNHGDEDAREAHTITGTATDGVYELGTTLTLTPGASCYVCPRDWDDVGADEQEYAYLSGDDGTLGTGADSGHRWSS